MNQAYDVELWNDLKSRFAPSRLEMLKSGQLTLNNRTMKFTYQTKGERPPNGYTLIFGLHGGGGCPANVNDQQYNNHKNLYNQQLPNGSIWFTPRSCEDEWDMWFKDYMEDFLLQFIRAFCLNDLVDINKVFVTGFSAGGDGVYHLAPRMADHLAGAAMCAGHPNNINLMNVRNISFAIQVGEKDNPYNRVNEAIKYSRMLSQLKQNYGGFENQCNIAAGKSHWMDREESKTFPWLFTAVRNPYPDVILFKQCPRRKQSTFYYLRFGDSKNGNQSEETVVMKEGNQFNVYSNRSVVVLVNRKMVNPNQPITIRHNDQVTVNRNMQTKPEICKKTLLERIDPYYIFQDEFASDPPAIINMKQTICKLFNISADEKDAEFEPELSKTPDQLPANFSKSMKALVGRKAPLPNFVGGLGRQGLIQPIANTAINVGVPGLQVNTNANVNNNAGWQKWETGPNQNQNEQYYGSQYNNTSQGYGQQQQWNGQQPQWIPQQQAPQQQPQWIQQQQPQYNNPYNQYPQQQSKGDDCTIA